jgi:hypothetical protein
MNELNDGLEMLVTDERAGINHLQCHGLTQKTKPKPKGKSPEPSVYRPSQHYQRYANTDG